MMYSSKQLSIIFIFICFVLSILASETGYQPFEPESALGVLKNSTQSSWTSPNPLLARQVRQCPAGFRKANGSIGLIWYGDNVLTSHFLKALMCAAALWCCPAQTTCVS
jgi:hypothetical protein